MAKKKTKTQPTGDGNVFTDEELRIAGEAMDAFPPGYFEGWDMRREGKALPPRDPNNPESVAIRMGWNDLHVKICNGDIPEPAPDSPASRTSPIIMLEEAGMV